MAENFFGITDTGKLRDNNEDTFIAERAGENYVIACVIDGVGGYAGGEVAAAIARDAIQRHFKDNVVDVIAEMRKALIWANDRIFDEKQSSPDYNKMACVLTLAVVDAKANTFYYAHIGDTRLYLYRDNSLVKVSKDHSFVGYLEDTGRLNEDAAMKHPKRNEINKALGFKQQIELSDDYIDTGKSPFLSGDMLLLCSDGLTDLVNKQQISEILSGKTSLEQKGQSLIAAANEKGGKDNITVVLVQNSKVRSIVKATRPVPSPQPPAVPETKVVQQRIVKPREQQSSPTPPIPAKPIKRRVETAKKPANASPNITPGPVAEDKPVAAVSGNEQTNGSGNHKIVIIALSILCAILLCGIIYLLTNRDASSATKQSAADTVSHQDNPAHSAGDSLIMVDTSKRVDSIHR